MRILDIIEKKKLGEELSKEEISFWIKGLCSGDIPDYQTSALLMAIRLKGMNQEETVNLCQEMVHSGDILDLSEIEGIKADKHSTGGVGDKTSLVLGPLVASCGLKIAKMSGRGLGHTGGTLDKLESISGLNIFLSEDEFKKQVAEIGIAIVGQTGELVPADKKLYALRDVTATVDSIPLISSSIMSKKLAAGSDTILLDVKYGKGAFMHTVEDAKKLAKTMISIGKSLGKNTMAMITDMNAPLGRTIGNALEIKEAVLTLKGQGEESFTEFIISAAKIMLMQGKITSDEAEADKMLRENIKNGKAFLKFKEMVKSQGGNVDQIDDLELLPKSKHIEDMKSKEEGYISKINSEELGILSMKLGGGRKKKEDKINYAVGIIMDKKVGDYVKIGDSLGQIHYDDLLDKQLIDSFYQAYEFSKNKVEKIKVIEEILK
ncbi:pyrimidine-nucleoside phosphorylase [Peptoniphilus lacrimalis]|uniref:pyrimidine-nucleoside phosphorylase n=1 Tax=Peptoniphilus lacrimalis TaxID=33031 RepID=UPI0023FA1C14|nr:pyrimidine-nucleoside phosphorylase [Peptoniphilus lacrimalis]MDK7722858.1 pyrimidine-nucleoside phosphorylase [Peptoniphilus lacrimalis]MDK7732460.1 pyrimidine-nucleoside phosphorylase [Peptoniphilus lacrimalis]MDK8282493.1 pyrimidine-nucleoside phosphorylase [Peptoniphilus lacrimalis]